MKYPVRNFPAPQLPPRIPFTHEAYEKLQQDFDRLTEERKEIMIRLKTAREMGDLSENGAYIYAKFELGSVGRQLRELRHLLDNGDVIQKKAGSSTVQFGCSVTVRKEHEEITYQMVSMHESNLLAKKLSIESPLGKALLDKKVGDTVSVETPRGNTTYTILKIE
jgi:transcription elongation factor GreA